MAKYMIRSGSFHAIFFGNLENMLSVLNIRIKPNVTQGIYDESVCWLKNK